MGTTTGQYRVVQIRRKMGTKQKVLVIERVEKPITITRSK